MGKVARTNGRSAARTAERITEEEVHALAVLVNEVGVLERRTNHARAALDAYALDLEARYKLKTGDTLDTDTGAITRRTSGLTPVA